jgi:hypothetical protein
MKLWRLVISFIAAMNMSIGLNVAHASEANSSPANSSSEAQHPHLETFVDQEGHKTLTYDTDTKQVVTEIPHATQEEILESSPETINKTFGVKNIVKTGLHVGKETINSMPVESYAFFMAMGALTAYQVALHYPKDPVGFQHHIETQLSPVGVFSFNAFMWSQGLTSNLLFMTKFGASNIKVVPLIGMSAGFFVQKYVSTFLSDPNTQACGRWMAAFGNDTNESIASCQKSFVKVMQGHNVPPDLLAMLVTVGGVSLVKKLLARITGVEVAALFAPGGTQFKTVRILAQFLKLEKITDLAIFSATQTAIEEKLELGWRNLRDGSAFSSFNKDFNKLVNKEIQTNWKSDDNKLSSLLSDFQERMADWRQTNLTEMLTSYKGWSDNLSQLVSMYNSSHDFYQYFAETVLAARTNKNRTSPLDLNYPLNGVRPNDMKDGADSLAEMPDKIYFKQREAVNLSAKLFEEIKKLNWYNNLSVSDKSDIQKLQTLLASQDDNQMAAGLNLFNKVLEVQVQNIAAPKEYVYALRNIHDFLGNPEPMMEKGRGFIVAHEASAQAKKLYSETNYYRQVGIFTTPRMTDYLLMQMICGPDIELGKLVVKNSRGFPSVFLPPQIKKAGDNFSDVCESMRPIPTQAGNAIYNWNIQLSGNRQYKGFLEYLIANARGSVIGDKGAQQTRFDSWWSAQVETQMQNAFAVYNDRYNDIAVELMNEVYRQDQNPLNKGPVYNGPMNAAFQEVRTLLALADELIQPTGKFNFDLRTALLSEPRLDATKQVYKQFAGLNYLTRKIKIVKQPKTGRLMIQSDVENSEIQDKVKDISEVSKKLAGICAQIFKGKYDTKKVILIAQIVNELNAVATEIGQYALMVNVANWDKTNQTKGKQEAEKKAEQQTKAAEKKIDQAIDENAQY